MTRVELIKRLYAHPLRNYKQGTLEQLSNEKLEELLRLLDATWETQGRVFSEGSPDQLQELGDEPPELTEEAEKAPDKVYGRR